MKPLLFSLAVITMLFSACKKDTKVPPPPVSDVNLKKGLLLYLPFNGNMADSSGNGNPTTPINGAQLTSDQTGAVDSAFGCNGQSQSLVITNNGSIKFDSSFSVSLDFSLRNVSHLTTLFGMVDYQNGYGEIFNFGLTDPSGPANFHFGVNVDDSTTCSNYGQNSPTINHLSNFQPSTDSWYNTVCIFNKGYTYIYINGSLVGTDSSSTPLHNKVFVCPNSNLVLGNWWAQAYEGLDGKIDNVRLYNRVLNADEIAEVSKAFKN